MTKTYNYLKIIYKCFMIKVIIYFLTNRYMKSRYCGGSAKFLYKIY